MAVRKVLELCGRPITCCVELACSPFWGPCACGVCLRDCVLAWWVRVASVVRKCLIRCVCFRKTDFPPRFANPGSLPGNMGDVDFDADMKRILDRCAVGAYFRKWFPSLGMIRQGGVAVKSPTGWEVRATIIDEAAKPGDNQVADATSRGIPATKAWLACWKFVEQTQKKIYGIITSSP